LTSSGPSTLPTPSRPGRSRMGKRFSSGVKSPTSVFFRPAPALRPRRGRIGFTRMGASQRAQNGAPTFDCQFRAPEHFPRSPPWFPASAPLPRAFCAFDRRFVFVSPSERKFASNLLYHRARLSPQRGVQNFGDLGSRWPAPREPFPDGAEGWLKLARPVFSFQQKKNQRERAGLARFARLFSPIASAPPMPGILQALSLEDFDFPLGVGPRFRRRSSRSHS